MKRFAYIFCKIALVPLFIAGVGVGLVWRGSRQQENDKALLDAIKANNTFAAIAALKRGANPNTRDMPDDTRSLKQRFTDMIHHTGPRSEIHEPALYRAITMHTEDTVTVRALLEAGANPNVIIIFPRTSDEYVDYPLNIAESWSRAAVAHLLLEYHANIQVRGGDGNTPLLNAAIYENWEEVKFLLQHSSNVEEENEDGIRLLMIAASDGNRAMVKYLI